MPSYGLTSGNLLDPRTGKPYGTYAYAILPVTVQGITEDGQAYGRSWSGNAMIDTWANVSAVHSSVAGQLHLALRGRERDATESQLEPAALYMARVTIDGGARCDLPVVHRDYDPDLLELFGVLIGTDILQSCRFAYNDPPGRFTLDC
jgi:hypothetical protein